MELALSVGGDPSRKRKIYRIGNDQIPTRQRLVGVDEEDNGGGLSPVELDLRLSWSTDTVACEGGISSSDKSARGGGLDVNEIPLPSVHGNEMGPSSSDSRPNEAGKRGDCETDVDRGSSRCSDEEEGGGGSTRKKLRLSKEQSCYLEESFKEHPTLNPKQKLSLAKQLNLRPRQVEVWFQNRRARTKLKQTEVDCEYLKRCCESLREENRRLHKELQELKALRSPHNPFHVHGPATTLTMCPSCERVSTTTMDMNARSKISGFDVTVHKSRLYPFSLRMSSAAS